MLLVSAHNDRSKFSPRICFCSRLSCTCIDRNRSQHHLLRHTSVAIIACNRYLRNNVTTCYSIAVNIEKGLTYECHHCHRQPASVLCCSRLSCLSSSEHPIPRRQTEPNVSISPPAACLSTINVQTTVAPDATTPDITVTSSRNDAGDDGTQLVTVARSHFHTVDNMKQTVSIDVLVASVEDEHCL